MRNKNKKQKIIKNDDLSDEAVANAIRDGEAAMGREYEKRDLIEKAHAQTANNIAKISQQVNFYRAEQERRKQEKEKAPEAPKLQEVKP